jgi:2-oxoisovalerate dehydrogenase E2 component (dihydrolipoyl transacylase)
LQYSAESLQPLVDIDVDGELPAEEETLQVTIEASETAQAVIARKDEPSHDQPRAIQNGSQTHATPAVRHLSKTLGIDLAKIQGTGRGGRVLKEDLQAYAAERDAGTASAAPAPAPTGEDRTIRLDGFRGRMFKTMTESLSIPHFMFSDPVDFAALTAARRQCNASDPTQRLSSLPFIVKAVSAALKSYPSLNAHLTTSDAGDPVLVHRAAHDIGVAIDTPHGLVVPVLRDVCALTVREIASEIARLAALARANKLAAADLRGATFTVSNIGSIAGSVVAPVIVAPQVAILGVGRARAVPGFDEEGALVRREEAIFSWSADHRVVDGATVARAAEKVKRYLEGLGDMLADMR